MKILVVDDDALVFQALERWLTKHGHYACWSATAEGAFSVLETEEAIGQPCDLAIIDYHLGDGIDGVEFARRLRRHPSLRIKSIAAIILTGDTPSSVHNQLKARALAEREALLSVRLIVQKPVNFEDFAAVLRTIEKAL